MEIIIECKPDETLMKALGFTRKAITHQPNKGMVINLLEKKNGVIGVVDEDPGTTWPRFFSKFQKIDDQHGIVNYKLQKQNLKLIVIKPRLEEWIISQAQSVNIDPIRFSLPADGHNLHKVINTRLLKFDELLKTMINQNSTGLLYLQQLLKQT